MNWSFVSSTRELSWCQNEMPALGNCLSSFFSHLAASREKRPCYRDVPRCQSLRWRSEAMLSRWADCLLKFRAKLLLSTESSENCFSLSQRDIQAALCFPFLIPLEGWLAVVSLRHSRSCAACCRWPCFSRKVGLDDPQWSLPTPTIQKI